MADNINRSDVEVDFKDIYGKTIADKVEIKIYNTQLQSLKDIYNVSFKGNPVTLAKVPAFPTGHAQMIVRKLGQLKNSSQSKILREDLQTSGHSISLQEFNFERAP
jgi:hypothetical protein